ncbi:MAG: efflux RND transporter periplasmic adaptor subunit, partial [Pirellulaceae bacterium]
MASIPQQSEPEKRFSIWTRLLIAVLVIGGLGAGGISLINTTAGDTESELVTFSARRGDLVVFIKETGTLESSNNKEIKCKVRGYNTVNWVIPSGTIVKKGDELVRLDTRVIEETLSLQKTNVGQATAILADTKAEAAKAQITFDEYEEGPYKLQNSNLMKELRVAQSNLVTAQKQYKNKQGLFKRGSISELALQAEELTVQQSQLDLDVAKTNLDVFERITKEMQLVRMNGSLTATGRRLLGRQAGLELDEFRRDVAAEELGSCVIKADRDGLVIYPSSAGWKETPDVTEGASVRKDQTLLLMPDLSTMQITVGIHQSIVERVKAGHPVSVTLPTQQIESTIDTIAPVANPGGWWNGHVVKYDAVIKFPEIEGLKPGMSAEVEVELASYQDVLYIPVNAIVDSNSGLYCWVKTNDGYEQRSLEVGDSNDDFVVIENGVSPGEQVVTSPAIHLPEAQQLIADSPIHSIGRQDVRVTITEQGSLESANNTEIKNLVRGSSTINWVIESGSIVKEGDELLRLENKDIEEFIRSRTKYMHLSHDASVGTTVRAKIAELAVKEFLEGDYIVGLYEKKKELARLKTRLNSSWDELAFEQRRFKRGYSSVIKVEDLAFRVTRNENEVMLKELDIKSYEGVRRETRLADLNGEVDVSTAMMKKDLEVLRMDDIRIQQAKDEFKFCIVKAPRDGLVIYPNSRSWKNTPDITEGSVVTKEQVMLLMPDLTQIQVKVGIHESVIDRVATGMGVRIKINNKTMDGTIKSVAVVAEPAHVWNGNMVRYDTIITLPSPEGLQPGMTAEVEIVLDHHKNVLTIPVSAVERDDKGYFCWVQSTNGSQRRHLKLGDANGEVFVIESGLTENEEVILNPSQTLG